MASILDMYGIKEVADVTLYRIDGNNLYTPVLYLDTLKVSTIEETASSADATGGKGNAKLVSWDFGKEITVTLEDALFSMESMALMHGALSTPGQGKKGTVSGLKETGNEAFFTQTARCLGTGTNGTDLKSRVTLPAGIDEGTDVVFYGPQGEKIATGAFKEGEWYIAQWKVQAGDNVQVIEISANSFPGTYKLEGTTYIREQATGTDKFFKFEIPMAKMDPAQTITMQADGDPSTFSMTMKVLRPSDGVMMRLIAYPDVEVNGTQEKYEEDGG